MALCPHLANKAPLCTPQQHQTLHQQYHPAAAAAAIHPPEAAAAAAVTRSLPQQQARTLQPSPLPRLQRGRSIWRRSTAAAALTSTCHERRWMRWWNGPCRTAQQSHTCCSRSSRCVLAWGVGQTGAGRSCGLHSGCRRKHSRHRHSSSRSEHQFCPQLADTWTNERGVGSVWGSHSGVATMPASPTTSCTCPSPAVCPAFAAAPVCLCPAPAAAFCRKCVCALRLLLLLPHPCVYVCPYICVRLC